VKATEFITEGQTDYQRRRQRERDVDAGKPVTKSRQPKMTDYQRRRAQQKKEMEMGEATADQFGQAVRMASQTGKHLEQDPETHREIRRTQQQLTQREKNLARSKAGYGNEPDEYNDVDEAKDGDVNFGHTVGQGSWIVYDPETRQIKKRFKTHTAGKSYAKAHNLGFASSEFYFDKVKQSEVDEHIVKVKGGYRLLSKHGDKNLGTYPSRAGAEKRERQVQYFKHAGK
jgi:CubicO group peptidase (beta-lactamase class C family)